MNYFVYMLLCADGSYYIGVTNNLERTHERRPVRLIYSADFQRIEQAIAWEKQIKGWSRAKKAALAAGDRQRIRLLARPSTQDDSGGSG